METRQTIACLAVMLGVFFAGFVAGSPDYNGDCSNAQSSEQTLIAPSSHPPNTAAYNAQKADCHSPKWYAALKRPEWLGIIVGTITFIFIGWQSWATRESADAAKQSIELQKHQAEIMQQQISIPYRAYLSVGNPATVGDEIKFPIENYGHVAGRITHVSVEIIVQTLPGRKEVYRRDIQKAVDVLIAPGKTAHHFALSVYLDLRPQNADVVVGGAITYDVGFSGSDTVHFTNAYNTNLLRWVTAYESIEVDFRDSKEQKG
jgi:hypothetical protein